MLPSSSSLIGRGYRPVTPARLIAACVGSTYRQPEMSGPPLASKRSIVAAGALAALAGASVAIAAGFGAFDGSSPFTGISAAQHRLTAADRLDPAVAASFAPDLRRDGGSSTKALG